MAATQTVGIPNQASQGQRASGAPPNAQPNRAAAASGSAGQNQPGQNQHGQNRPAQAGAAGTQIAVAPQQERALVPASTADESTDDETNSKAFGTQIARLPVELDVSIPLHNFRVRDLLALEPGRLVQSEWSSGVDLPLAAGAVQLAWSEFEVIETLLVVRLTRLA
jgi:flagellar motor switch protein FliN/FliY